MQLRLTDTTHVEDEMSEKYSTWGEPHFESPLKQGGDIQGPIRSEEMSGGEDDMYAYDRKAPASNLPADDDADMPAGGKTYVEIHTNLKHNPIAPWVFDADYQDNTRYQEIKTITDVKCVNVLVTQDGNSRIERNVTAYQNKQGWMLVDEADLLDQTVSKFVCLDRPLDSDIQADYEVDLNTYHRWRSPMGRITLEASVYVVGDEDDEPYILDDVKLFKDWRGWVFAKVKDLQPPKKHTGKVGDFIEIAGGTTGTIVAEWEEGIGYIMLPSYLAPGFEIPLHVGTGHTLFQTPKHSARFKMTTTYLQPQTQTDADERKTKAGRGKRSVVKFRLHPMCQNPDEVLACIATRGGAMTYQNEIAWESTTPYGTSYVFVENDDHQRVLAIVEIEVI